MNKYGKSPLSRAAQAAHDVLYRGEPHPMQECEDIARAVVAAIREASPSMIAASDSPFGTAYSSFNTEDAAEVWAAMVDALLAEG